MSETKGPQTEPARLSEEGGVMAALGEMRTHGLSAERLEQGRAALANHTAGQAASAASGAGAVKIALVVFGLGLVAGIWLALRDSSESASARSTAPPAPVTTTLRADAGVTPAMLAIDAAPADSIVADAAPPPKAGARKASRTETNTPAPSNQLAEQLAMLQEARDLAQNGHHEEALRRLARLESRFPGSPLQAEVDLRRAVILNAAGKLAAAHTALARLLQDPQHAGRRAQLYRMLVDITVQLGDCEQARNALEKARAAGLGHVAQLSAQRGIDSCVAAPRKQEEK